MTEGLLPCHRCNGEGFLYFCNRGYVVRCCNCSAVTPFYPTSAQAANYWNYLYFNNKSEVNNES